MIILEMSSRTHRAKNVPTQIHETLLNFASKRLF